MKDRLQELKAEAKKADAEEDVLAKIAEMSEPDRIMGERLHAIIKASAPALSPKLWYGMPAYAKDGKIVCFFQGADKFKVRYSTFGFNEDANLDDGAMWPTSFALKELTADSEKRIAAQRDEVMQGLETMARDIGQDVYAKIAGQPADQTALAAKVAAAKGGSR